MLGSITPLGERGRGQHYPTTILFFLLGSVAAGTGIGAALGSIGALVVGRGTVALALLAGALCVGLTLDLGVLRLRLPSPRRQVDETWLTRYRGWLYGAGFGCQLGVGVVTVVTTSAVYVAFAAALLSGSVVAGAVIGGVFGLGRWACAAAGALIKAPADLGRLSAIMSRLERPARRLTLVMQWSALVAVIAVIAL